MLASSAQIAILCRWREHNDGSISPLLVRIGGVHEGGSRELQDVYQRLMQCKEKLEMATRSRPGRRRKQHRGRPPVPSRPCLAQATSFSDKRESINRSSGDELQPPRLC